MENNNQEKILNGKELATKLKEEVAKKIKEEKLTPKLAIVSCGNDVASEIYIRNKKKACELIGIEFIHSKLEGDIEQKELLEVLKKLNEDETVDGILLQYPIPKHLNLEEAFENILPEKDVDGFSPINIGKLTIGEDCFIPCTPLGIMKIFDYYNIQLESKKVVIVGRSNTVGKPLAQCLLHRNATITICHSKTKNLKDELLTADIVISAVGKEKIIKADMIKQGAIVIDVGINRNSEGKVCGDVDFENVKEKVSYITPVPGGVGPMTVAMLMNNVYEAHKKRNGRV